jgi:hypothetical protein
MKLPFTTEDFFKVIENYNQSVFPIQVIFLIAGIYATVVLFRNPSGAGKTIGLILCGYGWEFFIILISSLKSILLHMVLVFCSS